MGGRLMPVISTLHLLPFFVLYPLALSNCAAHLVHELLELCGLSLAAAPILHALVENWDARMVQALIVNSLCTVGLLAAIVLAALSFSNHSTVAIFNLRRGEGCDCLLQRSCNCRLQAGHRCVIRRPRSFRLNRRPCLDHHRFWLLVQVARDLLGVDRLHIAVLAQSAPGCVQKSGEVC